MSSLSMAGETSRHRLKPAPAPKPIEVEPSQLTKVTGVIKWFDASKGYGFIVADGDMGDVLLHATCLKRSGFQIAYQGARVVCEVQSQLQGLQAFRVVSMDESTAIKPPRARTHERVMPTSGLEQAIVQWFNHVRGYGFVTRGEGTKDIFVHMETLRSCGIADLQPGQTVLVRYGTSSKGLIATEIRPHDGTVNASAA
jgi:CspA family cold shock protein